MVKETLRSRSYGIGREFVDYAGCEVVRWYVLELIFREGW